MMRKIKLNDLTADARELVRNYLDQSAVRSRHDGNDEISRAEAARVTDLNSDGRVNLDDWRVVACPDYPVSRQAFEAIVGVFRPLYAKGLVVENFGLGEALRGAAHAPLFIMDEAADFLGESVIEEKKRGAAYLRLEATAKAELHIHIGGNARAEFLYEQALYRVGPGALDPEKWGGRLDWSDAETYYNFRFGQDDEGMETFDDVLEKAQATSIPADEFTEPSFVIAHGQKIERALAVEKDPAEIARLRETRSENVEAFGRLCTYAPMGRPGYLSEFLAVYSFHSDLVESTTSLHAQTASIIDGMREMSKSGTRYAEMRVEAPRLEMARAVFPGASDEEAVWLFAERTLLNAAAAVERGNRLLIAEGFDPVDYRLVYAISKSESRPGWEGRNFAQTAALVRFLETHPDKARAVVGFDAAAQETHQPPKLYLPHLKLIRDYNARVDAAHKIGITFHQGEDFTDTDLFSAIRRVEDLVDFGVNRIGHATALGVNPRQYLDSPFSITLTDYRDELVYERAHAFKTPIPPCVDGALADADEEIARVDALIAQRGAQAVLAGRYPRSGTPEAAAFLEAARERQTGALRKVREKGITIEVNPTSNVYMSLPTDRMEEHPLPFFLAQGVKVAIDSDDPGIFATQINREYVSAALTAGLSEAEVFALIAGGFDSSFAASVRGESLSHLKTPTASAFFAIGD